MRVALPFVLLLLAAGSAGAGRVDNPRDPALLGLPALGGALVALALLTVGLAVRRRATAH